MAEGRTKAYYRSDRLSMYDNTGTGQQAQFVEKVPNNLYAQSALDWQAEDVALPAHIGIPHGFKPRHVIGRGTNGKTYRVQVATPDAPLWVNDTVHTWTIVDNFGGTITVTRTGAISEYAPD